MAATITVLYENVDGARFDLDYYLGTHMPLVDERFARFGLKGWQVVKATGTPTGDTPRFSIVALLSFETTQQFHDAVAAEGAAVFGDVPNFSDQTPVVVMGDVVGSRS